MNNLVSKKLAVMRVLRDFPDLRPINKRQRVWGIAKKDRADLTWPQVDRLCRDIQNDKVDGKTGVIKEGRYKPIVEDGRFEREKEYRELFGST